ncbi:OmpA family protein [Gelidibacter mesophilus]|uniref:OmpA family protein n=1 Tax=Gelidibacter mesophilus TaxID=169050 RepID=UPI00040DBF84|nr:OmpA family protein [Gelidibacter mesophilus]
MKTKLFIFFLAFSSTFMVAQKKLADKFFENFAYVKATELYEEAVKKGDSSEHVLTRLGDCYYNNSRSKEAAFWYGKAVNKYDKVNPEYIFKYIQSLRSIKDYQKADKWLVKFKNIQGGDSRVKDFDANNLDLYEDLASTEDLIVTIENMPFNTQYSDFGSYVFGDQLYFASARDTVVKKRYGWNAEPFLDIYFVTVTESEGKKEFTGADFINSSKINTPYHEASIAMTNDGQTMYFTRDNVNRRNKLGYDRKGTSHLKLYKASLDNGNWNNVVELPFNDDYFSNGHPALSPDNKQLFFVSDREGGFGQTDIYVVDILEDGKYSEPRNLGPKVNTEGREMFPFVANDNTFYFSSDGYLNLGLLDIYKSKILTDANAEPENLGAPYNSGYDDFAFFLKDDSKKGYFSSNRPGGKGSDDIYAFNAEPCKQIIQGIARNSKTNEVLANVEVQLINTNGKIIATEITSATGAYVFEADCDKSFTLLGSKKDYKNAITAIVTNLENGKVNIADLYLIPLIEDNQIVINPIFFDFDKWNIRTDAEYELENIVDVMREHPGMVIKIESHTDSRGSDNYNMKLSDRRAKSTRDYILSRGITADRIESAIGYGETQLLNKCANGVKCTAEEHQLNRRSYFYILKD